jgi:hypothetical protein
MRCWPQEFEDRTLFRGTPGVYPESILGNCSLRGHDTCLRQPLKQNRDYVFSFLSTLVSEEAKTRL